MTDSKMIQEAVFGHYMDTKKAASAVDISKRLCWSVSKVRKVLRNDLDAVSGLDFHQESRPTHKLSHRGLEYGTVEVWVYQPSRAFLRERLLIAMGKADLLLLETWFGKPSP